MATPSQLSLVYRQDAPPTVDDIASMMAHAGFDLLLIESFGDFDQVDRYVVARIERNEEPLLGPEDSAGIITDDADLSDAWKKCGRSSFDINNVAQFAEYLVEQYSLG
jgi:molybdopterin-guanine dinucleotide biosynthesis protein